MLLRLAAQRRGADPRHPRAGHPLRARRVHGQRDRARLERGGDGGEGVPVEHGRPAVHPRPARPAPPDPARSHRRHHAGDGRRVHGGRRLGGGRGRAAGPGRPRRVGRRGGPGRAGCDPDGGGAGGAQRVSRQAAAPSASPEVVTLGETMVLLMAEQSGPLREATSFRRLVGGAESNVAAGLSRVGNDDFGRVILHRLRGEGVDLAHAVVDAEAPTGVMIRERRELGAIEVLYYRRGSAASRLGAADVPERYVAGAQHLYLTGITPALSASCRQASFHAAEVARGAGVPVVFDPNMRRKLWSDGEARPVMRDLAAQSDVVLPGVAEAELITGEPDPLLAAQALLALGPRLVVLKLGEQGALAVGAGGEVVQVPAAPLQRVVDPVGAGDAFAAGFLAATLDGEALAEALDLRPLRRP